MNFWDWLLKKLKPFTVWWGKLHLPFTRKKITGKFYYKVRDLIEPGTVLLTSTHGEFSNLINPVDIKHGAIYIGKAADGICYVTEALGRGVVKTDLITFLTTKDVVVGVKPTFLLPQEAPLIKMEAEKLIGIPYDYLFQKDRKKLYCFENIATVFKAVRPDLNLKCTEIVKGKRIYDSNTFLKDAEKFTLMFDSRKIEL